MANPGQPTIRDGAEGGVVRRLQRALHRTPNPGITIDGIFGPQLEVQVKLFQQASGLTVDGIVGPQTWAIHVPLGKLKTERMIPVDAFVCKLVHRLRLLRPQDPLPADAFLLARPTGRDPLIYNLRRV